MKITVEDIKDVLLTMKNRTAKKKQIAFLLDCSEWKVRNAIKKQKFYEIAEGCYGYFYWGNRSLEELNLKERKILLAHINGQIGVRRYLERYQRMFKKWTENIEPSGFKKECTGHKKEMERLLNASKKDLNKLIEMRNDLMANLK
ncbi:hypothetical protein ES705_17153 [subsurface metagenome]